MYRDTSCNPRCSWSGESAQQDEQEVLSSFLLEVLREGFKKKNCEKAVRLTALGGEGGSPPLSLTTSICENVDPFLSFIKLQNNPKYGNLSNIPPGGVDTCLFAPPSETVGVVLFLSAEDQTKCYVNLS